MGRLRERGDRDVTQRRHDVERGAGELLQLRRDELERRRSAGPTDLHRI